MNSKKTVLFVMQLPPPVHGASLMNKLIHDSNVINDNDVFSTDYLNLTTAKDISDIGKKGLSKYISAIGIYFAFIKKILLNRPSLCYVTLSPHGVAFYKDAFIILILKVFRIKRVIHLHGKGIAPIIKKSTFKRFLYRFTFKNSKVIHLSEKLFFDIKDLVSQEAVSYLANGIAVTDTLEHKAVNNTILYLSNLQESKGSFDLLQASKILKDKGYKFTLNFVGKWHNDSSFKDRFLKYYETHNLTDVVNYLGPKYGNEKFEQFNKSTFFVLPTLNDCFPISILEAMSQKLVVLTTDEGATTDIIKNNINGIIVEKKNPESIANAIAKLLEDEDLVRSLSSQAYSDFNSHYTNEIFEASFFDTISRLL